MRIRTLPLCWDCFGFGGQGLGGLVRIQSLAMPWFGDDVEQKPEGLKTQEEVSLNANGGIPMYVRANLLPHIQNHRSQFPNDIKP